MGTRSVKKTLMEMLGDKHNDWTYMLRGMMKGKATHTKDEEIMIIGDMYIRMNKYVKDPDKIMYGDEINTMFVYTVLRNCMNHYLNKKHKQIEYPSNITHINDEFEDDYNAEYYEGQIELTNEIMEEVESWHWFQTRMFKIINQDGVTMRQLARDTGISLSTVFNGNKKSREKLRDKFQDKYNRLKD